MIIWIDADACPKVIKEIVFRVSERLQLHVKLVANSSMWIPTTKLVEIILVGKGLDVADSYIAENCNPDDVVITADVPLAGRIIEKQAWAINPRGELYSQANIAERLSVRNFMQDLRDAGERTGGPPSFSDRDKQKFANSLDALLTRLLRKRPLSLS